MYKAMQLKIASFKVTIIQNLSNIKKYIFIVNIDYKGLTRISIKLISPNKLTANNYENPCFAIK